MKFFKKMICIVMIAALIASVFMMSTISTGAASTGVGLAEWAMRAYNEGWDYVWGGASVGAVDCSGLIYSYCGGNRTSMLYDAQANGRDWGYVSDGIPNIHGLGLSRPNHVGVYVGNGMEIDARGDDYGVCYQAVGDRWECWFKLTAITYPTTGWQVFNGNYYYYENGEYLADTSRTIDGTTYYFASSGVSSTVPSGTSSSSGSKTNDSSSGKKQNTAPSTSTSSATVDDGPLKKGSQGERVEKLQARLQELGYYDGVIDGDFGAMTEKAFKLFQKQAGLYEDGIAGSDADYLYSDDAPAYEPVQTEAPATENTERKKDTAATGVNLTEAEAIAEDTDPAEDEEDEEPFEAEEAEEEAPCALRYANGDSGVEVITIQEQLIKLGYLDGDADGSFGAMTETAVREFQTVNKLEGSGVIDQETYDVLFSAAPAARPTEAPAPTVPSALTTANTAATVAKDTAVERDNAALSQKSVANITPDASGSSSRNANLEFIVWLAIMIVVMIIAFIIVFTVEKKRSKAMTYVGRRFQ